MEEKISMEDRDSAEEAVGLLEVFGLVCAFMAADAGCKAADVRLEVFDKNKPANADALPVPLLVTVKFRGSVAAVEAAMEAGEAVAKSLTGVVQRHIIPRPPTPGAHRAILLQICIEVEILPASQSTLCFSS